MALLIGEAKEPPGRRQATRQRLDKAQSPIKALSPVQAPPAPPPNLVVLAQRPERFPIGPPTRAFRQRYFSEIELAQWNDWRWQARKPHPHARRARAHLRAVRRRARRGDAPSRLAAARHHAVLREPDEPRGRDGAAAAHAYPGRHRISEDAGRGRRPARRGRPYRRTGPRAPLSRPRAVPGHRLLLDLLPLLHALAHGRRAGRRVFLHAARNGRRRSTISRRIPRSATC